MNKNKPTFSVEIFKDAEWGGGSWFFDIHMNGYRGQVKLESPDGYDRKSNAIKAAQAFCDYLGVNCEIKCID